MRRRTDSQFRWNRSHKYNSEYDFPLTKSCTQFRQNIAPPDTLLKLSAGIFHHAHYYLYCVDWRWSKHGSTWVAVSGGRTSETILTDANLFCIHALMCVNRRSRPWDQRGLPLWSEINTHATAAVDTGPLSNPATLLSLIICQLLTLAGLGINQCWQTTVTTSPRGHCR